MKHSDPVPPTSSQNELATYLKSIRSVRKLSLREVEDASGVSNAYLSQLEQAKINKPSPQTLHKLANCYSVSYESLMSKAGYISAAGSENGGTISEVRSGQLAPTALGKITRAEEDELLNYLGYLRSKQTK